MFLNDIRRARLKRDAVQVVQIDVPPVFGDGFQTPDGTSCCDICHHDYDSNHVMSIEGREDGEAAFAETWCFNCLYNLVVAVHEDRPQDADP